MNEHAETLQGLDFIIDLGISALEGQHRTVVNALRNDRDRLYNNLAAVLNRLAPGGDFRESLRIADTNGFADDVQLWSGSSFTYGYLRAMATPLLEWDD